MPRKVRIWFKIFFIVLVAVIPTVAITVVSAISWQRSWFNERKSRLTDFCYGFTNEQRFIVRNAEETLLAISQTQAVQDREYKQLNLYLKNLMAVYGNYSVILVADSSGQVVASGVNKTAYSVADREYFEHAQATGIFSPGSYIVSRSTGIPSITFTLPVRDHSGEMVYIIGTYNLDKYSNELSLSRLPKNTVLEIFDYLGNSLFSNCMESGSAVGDPVDKNLFSLAKAGTAPVTGKVTLETGDYLVSMAAFTRNNRSIYISVRSPYATVLQESWYPALFLFAVMLLACVLAFGLSLAFARRLIVDRIEALTVYAGDLERGNLGVRFDISDGRDEISDLMESFNTMANALEERSLSKQQTIEEKEILLQELQKRVSDNLQILSSMINLQIEHSTRDDVRRALTTTHARIMALSLVYETIYRYSDVQQVQMQRYCTGLCEFLVSVYADVGSAISCDVSGTDVALPIEKALPLALVLNELVSNSLQHAFPHSNGGHIAIHFTRLKSDLFMLSLIDNGIGFEGDIHEKGTLGFEMIEALVEQVRGALVVNNRNSGFEICIQFPV